MKGTYVKAKATTNFLTFPKIFDSEVVSGKTSVFPDKLLLLTINIDIYYSTTKRRRSHSLLLGQISHKLAKNWTLYK